MVLFANFIKTASEVIISWGGGSHCFKSSNLYLFLFFFAVEIYEYVHFNGIAFETSIFARRGFLVITGPPQLAVIRIPE